MRKTAILPAAFVLALLLPTVAGMPTSSPDLTSETLRDEHFSVEEVFYAFAGTVCVGSFNATRGDTVNFNISSFGSDSFEVVLRIKSAHHGEAFNASETFSARGGVFTQTVTLEYDDSYNITVAKHPFYSTVTVKGEIDVHHQETATADDKSDISSSAPSQSPSPSPTESSNPKLSPATPATSPSEPPSLSPLIASPSPTQQPASLPREPPGAILSSDAWFAIALAVIVGVISGAMIVLRKGKLRNSDRFWHLAL